MADQPPWVQDLIHHLTDHPNTTNTTIVTNEKKLQSYGKDRSHHPPVQPVVAVVPESVEAVAVVVRFCWEVCERECGCGCVWLCVVVCGCGCVRGLVVCGWCGCVFVVVSCEIF